MFSKPEIDRILEAFIYEQNRLQKDDDKYFGYVSNMKGVNLSSMTAKDMDIIRDFLIDWGHMARTGVEKNIPKTKPIFQRYAGFLYTAQKCNLHASNLPPHEQTIQDLFESLHSSLGQISAAKTLHLICPGFFPLWDGGIIADYNSSRKAKYGSKLIQMVKVTPNSERATGKGYYDFMEFTKLFINKYHHKLSQIRVALRNANSQKKEKSLLKIVDEFNIFATHTPFCYLL